MNVIITHGYSHTRGENFTPDERRQLLAEIERLSAEVARLTTRHTKPAAARDALARKAYDACATLKEWPVNTKAPDDIRRGFWCAAFEAGISIAVIARVSHTHHRIVSKFNTMPVNPTTIAYRKARDAARDVFKAAAAKP
jgi:peptidoglycan/xylan/chitin deacetylase (PgdA/CDA1 family)